MKKEKIAKVGDKIRIVNAEVAVGFYENGDLLEVVGVDEYPSGVEVLVADDQHFHVYHTEYEIVEDGKEDDFVFTKEHVGMEVWCAIYRKGVVEAVLEKHNELEVRISDEIYLYDLKGCPFGSKVRTLFFSEPFVEIEGDENPPKKPFTPTLKQGDKVVIDTGDHSFIATIKEEKEDEVFIERQVSGIRYPKNCIKIYKLGEEVKL